MLTGMGRLSKYYKELKSRNWIKNRISITHRMTPKLIEISSITTKKKKKSWDMGSLKSIC